MSKFENDILKSAEISIQTITDEELSKINTYTLNPLTKDDIFTFKLSMCDNELDDRNYEPFNLQSLKDMQSLYVGKTVLKDHDISVDNQVARVYDTELIYDTTKTTQASEPFASLIAKCYMLKTSSNEDLIKDIQGGIKKEVSTSCRPKKYICSICGVDNFKTYCSHWRGKKYSMADGSEKVCYFTIDGVKEATEVSFVAVPSQPRASTTKEELKTNDNLSMDIQSKYLESYIFCERNEVKSYE